MKTWVKLYAEINHDPKLGRLTWAQRGLFCALLALAGEIDDRDDNDEETGRLDTVDNVAWRVRCSEQDLRDLMTTCGEGMICEQDGILVLVNYAKRQKRAPSDSRDAVKQRVKRHRDNKQAERNGHVTPLQEPVTAPESESESESESDTDTESHGAGAPGANAPTPAPPRTFQAWADDLRTAPNKGAVIQSMHHALFPDREALDFGRIGAAAKQVGSWGRLAQLMWEASTRPPAGNVLDFVTAVAKGKNSNGRASPPPKKGGPPGSPTEIMPSGLTRRQEEMNERAMRDLLGERYVGSTPS